MHPDTALWHDLRALVLGDGAQLYDVCIAACPWTMGYVAREAAG